jgi:hypothetical protein
LNYKFNNVAISRKNRTKKGMVFKPSFKCLKNKKIKSSDSQTRNFTLSEYIYIYYFILYCIRRAILIQKKKRSKRKKNMPYIILYWNDMMYAVKLHLNFKSILIDIWHFTTYKYFMFCNISSLKIFLNYYSLKSLMLMPNYY